MVLNGEFRLKRLSLQVSPIRPLSLRTLYCLTFCQKWMSPFFVRNRKGLCTSGDPVKNEKGEDFVYSYLHIKRKENGDDTLCIFTFRLHLSGTLNWIHDGTVVPDYPLHGWTGEPKNRFSCSRWSETLFTPTRLSQFKILHSSVRYSDVEIYLLGPKILSSIQVKQKFMRCHTHFIFRHS